MPPQADEDVFVNVKNLLDIVTRYASHVNTTFLTVIESNHGKRRSGDPELLVGHLQIGAQVIRNPHNKWFAPKYMMETDKYPDYVQGPAYLMSTKLAQVCPM